MIGRFRLIIGKVFHRHKSLIISLIKSLMPTTVADTRNDVVKAHAYM